MQKSSHEIYFPNKSDRFLEALVSKLLKTRISCNIFQVKVW